MVRRIQYPALLSLCLLFSIQGMAQNGAGSVYSIFGLGEMTRTNSTASQGMGFTSIGWSSPYSVNLVNPAANSQTGAYFNHVFDVGFYYANTTYETQSATENGSYGGLSNLSFWFKYNDRWNGTIGLSNYSNVGYNIYKSNVNSFQTGDYDIAYEGSGGLNELFFSNSYSIFKNFSVGLKLALIFGNISRTEDVTSEQSLKRYLSENSTVIAKMDAEYSLHYRLQRESYALNFGLVYKNPTNMNGGTSTSISEWDYSNGVDVDGNSLYFEEESESEYTLPRRIGFGISLDTEKFLLAGDIEFNQWSQAKIHGYTDDLRDSWRYAIGLELTPDRYGQQALGRISYRVGGYLQNSYLVVENQLSNTYGLTSGLGVPLKSGSAMNVSYHRKYNGTTSNDMILESTHEVTLNFSIRSRWFQRRKYD
ncbi:MAG: hypothetical protein ABJF11_19540 [Reichenbachiella sp.]|uniref:hypothetical protein n=1 Tax=Reichenbachiella sp. TaxID=2184521 RepID=UPI0032630504